MLGEKHSVKAGKMTSVKRKQRDGQAESNKKTVKLRQKCPQYKDWTKQCSVVLQLKINLKKNKISKEYFDAHYEKEYSKMKALNEILKEFVKNERNNGSVV